MLPNFDRADEISASNTSLTIDADGKLTYTIILEEDYQTSIDQLSKLFMNSDVDCLSIIPQIIYHLWCSMGKKKLAHKVKTKFCPDILEHDDNDSFESLYIASILINALMEAVCKQDNDQNSDSNDKLKPSF